MHFVRAEVDNGPIVAQGAIPVLPGDTPETLAARVLTVEHRLWLVTMRARAWADEFGTTAHHARRLGRMVLEADDPWQFIVSCPAPR